MGKIPPQFLKQIEKKKKMGAASKKMKKKKMSPAARKLDKNKDGKVTKEDFKSKRKVSKVDNLHLS